MADINQIGAWLLKDATISELGVQVGVFWLVMCVSVTVSTIAGIGAAVVMVILIEVLHGIYGAVDDSMIAIFTALIIQEVVIAPTNAFILRKHVCWPLVGFAGMLWMASEACGTRVMLHTNVMWLKRGLGGTLLLFLVLSKGLPTVKKLLRRCNGSAIEKDRVSPTASQAPPPLSRPRRRLVLNPVGIGKFQFSHLQEEDLEANPASKEEEEDPGKAPVSPACECNPQDGDPVPPAEEDGEVPLEKGLSQVALVKPEAKEPKEFGLRSAREWLLAVYLGLGGGFLRGTCGAPLLVLAGFVMMSGIGKDQWRATNAAMTFLGVPMRSYYFLFVKENFQPSRWPQMTGSFLGCIVGIPLGHYLSHKVNQALFHQYITAVVAVGAVLLLTNGMEVSVPLATCTAVAVMLAYLIRHLRKSSVREAEVAEEAEAEEEDDDAGVEDIDDCGDCCGSHAVAAMAGLEEERH
mmetsp:Transcript_34906/g.81656  ORF Transcript_34906/g.81656 Transcript_34906/m.81656 type:complete len:464 (+) Transcript_34906:132-1523(+)|eukprot:CAMPEP_0178425092 /NCGR_PEP_ID=MMETSP0689_2-20121128/28545_1 /TAXON_ID=160604 /ORGANISM="Amphidinium massartii, Strain CS-259" /LENGTH=463 /DNA_ID=CAMNT_0020046745 /DNA_START=46 /DNA_END=1437 /DNA_ORIENTATION=-